MEDLLYPHGSYEELAEEVIEILGQCRNVPLESADIGDSIDVVCEALSYRNAHRVVEQVREILANVRSKLDFHRATKQSCDVVRNSVGVLCL